MKEKINEKTEQILLGSLLGDGGVYQRSKNNKAHYSEVHSIKQKDYLNWKNIFLKQFDTKIWTYKQYEKVQKKYYEKIAVYSKSSYKLYEYRKLFYPNSKKEISREILNKLNLLGLSIWYCDDGNYHLTKKIVRIMTDSFSYTEQNHIKIWFKKRWNLNCKITKRNTGSYFIEFNVKESEKFLNLIKNYIPESMLYKLGHLWEGNKTILDEAKKRELFSKQRYYIKNKNKILSRQNIYRNRPKIKERERLVKKEYYKKNKDRILERTNNYHKNNKDKEKQQKKRYYLNNIERIRDRQRKYYLKNREKILIKQIAYNNRSEIKQKKKEYDKKRYISS